MGNIGAKPSVQTVKHSSKHQSIRHVHPHEKKKQVHVKQIARGNPERDIDNCFVVDQFIKDIPTVIINKEVDMNTNVININQQKPQGNFLKNKITRHHINSQENLLRNVQTQMSIVDINKLKHFDVPEFMTENQTLIVCKQCGRNFRDDIVQKHQLICKSIHKREIFISRKQRQMTCEGVQLKYSDELKQKKQIHSKKENLPKWIEESSKLRTYIYKNRNCKYQTIYQIKENQSVNKLIHDTNCKTCGKIIKKRNSQINNSFCCCKLEEQKTIKDIKKEQIFDVLEYSPKVKLMSCGQCDRKFNPDRLQKHESVCEEVFKQKRKIFESRNQRMNYEEQVKFNQCDKNLTKKIKEPMSTWRKQSEQLRSEIRNNMDRKYKTVYNVLDTSSKKNRITICQKCGTQIVKKAMNIHLAFCQATTKKTIYLHENK